MAWQPAPVVPPVRGAYQTVDGTGGLCDDCIAVDGAERGSWEFVGKGRGAFAPSNDLQYVGEGRGEYDFARPRRIGVQVWCGIALCVLVIIVVLIDVLITRFVFKKTEHQQAADVTVQVTQEPDRFACFEGDATHFHFSADIALSWSNAHKSWCCANKGVACATAPPPTEPPTLPPTTTAQPTTWILVPVPASNPAFMSPNIVHVSNFGNQNCQLGSYEFWEPAKQQFCCTHAQICGPPTTPAPVMDFNCAVSVGNDPSLWLGTKRTWCCANHNTGCTTTPAPVSEQCSQGNLLGWRNAAEQSYCCNTHGLGCTTTPPPVVVTSPVPPLFDCTSGFTNWEVNWGETRKIWCCRNFNRGCPPPEGQDDHSCLIDDIAGWSAQERLWCCTHKGRGCGNAS